MNFKEYQKKAASTALYMDKVKEAFPDLPENLYNLIGLSYAGLGLGEVGETQGKIKKIIRDSGGIITDEKKKEIVGELGDILWYVAAVCTELDIKMDYVAQGNIIKLASRKERGVLTGSGDDR